MGKNEAGKKEVIVDSCAKEPKHLVVNERMHALFRTSERLEEFVDTVEGCPRPIEVSADESKPSLLEVLNDLPGQIDSNICRINDALDRLRGMLF